MFLSKTENQIINAPCNVSGKERQLYILCVISSLCWQICREHKTPVNYFLVESIGLYPKKSKPPGFEKIFIRIMSDNLKFQGVEYFWHHL